jgi:hypothetical protein
VRRAVVVGAGSFGTAVAVLLARGGTRTTLQARTEDVARASCWPPACGPRRSPSVSGRPSRRWSRSRCWRALERAGIDAPVTSGLSRLISGEPPLDGWVALVRTTVPPPARWRPAVRRGFWRRAWARVRRWFGAPEAPREIGAG